MSIEEQIQTIAKAELETQLADVENRMKASYKRDNKELKDDIGAVRDQLEEMNAVLSDLVSRIEKLEEDLSNRFGLVVKLRKYTLDQLMSEYKRLTGSMRPDQEESVENAEI
jgi:peptidoglycan hydrolase CwlO-like protein